MGTAERGGNGASVPCGDCTACCTSSQFVHVAPDEVDTISRIPAGLLFQAPGLPRGNLVLGYDDKGHCPMFVDGGCSIYEDRPRTCRSYDCRVLPAAGVELDDADKALITERTRRWRFDFPTTQDHQLHAAVHAAATFLRDHADELPAGAVPRHPTQLAFLAVRIHHVFLDDVFLDDVFLDDVVDSGDRSPPTPPLAVVEAALRRARTG